MKYTKALVLIILTSILMACQTQVKEDSYVKKSIADSNLEKESINEVSELDECNPTGRNPWEFLISRYQGGIPEDYFIYLTQKELRLIRNSYYAEKGYQFKSEDLASYFETQSWYCPKYENVDSLISPMEQDFINFLLELEKKALNHYNENDIYQYFLNLFKTEPKIGRNPIPLYYQNKYLHLVEPLHVYSAVELINTSEDYMVFIYNDWAGDPSDGADFLTILDKQLNLLEKHPIANYEILSKNEIKEYLTKRIYDPDGDLYDFDFERFFLDTIGTRKFTINQNGSLKIEEKNN